MSRPVVVLAITGSIAAYKAPIVARLLLKRGARVIPLLTKSAREFIGSATLSGLTGERVHSSAFGEGVAGELHVDLAKQADVIAVVPATADTLARLAAGRADDLLTATALCAKCTVVLAPAMFPNMWSHPATQRNVAALAEDGRVVFVGPVLGEVASGDLGVGRMAEPEAIVDAIFSALSPRDLEGRHIVVSAGPTIEDLDPVRFIGNRSTGKMGFAIASRAKSRGAREVTTGTYHGVDFAQLSLGTLWSPVSAFGFGPYLETDLGSYLGRPEGASEASIYAFFTFGIQVQLMPSRGGAATATAARSASSTPSF